MLTENSKLKSSQAELLLKSATILFGLTFAFGLLITNVQLMELGFTDFSSLHARNILVGFCFILYVSLLLITIIPVSAALYFSYLILKSSSKLMSKILSLSLLMLSASVSAFLLVSIAGTLVGYLFPWGRPWEDGYVFDGSVWSLSNMISDTRIVYAQFLKAFWHQKTIVASALILFTLIPLIKSFKNFVEGYRFTATLGNRMAFFFLTLATILLLFGYSIDVYPNLRYNLGGGQPKIVALHIESKDKNLTDLIGTKSSAKTKSALVITKPVALWYQDSNFLYLSSLKNVGQGTTSVLAIDASAVHAIHYQLGYVEVDDGGQIIKVEIVSTDNEEN